jgi:hypothetical protein
MTDWIHVLMFILQLANSDWDLSVYPWPRFSHGDTPSASLSRHLAPLVKRAQFRSISSEYFALLLLALLMQVASETAATHAPYGLLQDTVKCSALMVGSLGEWWIREDCDAIGPGLIGVLSRKKIMKTIVRIADILVGFSTSWIQVSSVTGIRTWSSQLHSVTHTCWQGCEPSRLLYECSYRITWRRGTVFINIRDIATTLWVRARIPWSSKKCAQQRPDQLLIQVQWV